jgi:type I restriction enzyme S subunit
MSSSEWKSYKLGELATFFNGRAYKNEEFLSSGTPIVRIQNLTGEGKTVYSNLELENNKYINGNYIRVGDKFSTTFY